MCVYETIRDDQTIFIKTTKERRWWRRRPDIQNGWHSKESIRCSATRSEGYGDSFFYFCTFLNCFFFLSWHISLDINELNLPKTCNTEFPDPDDLLTFKLIICPDEGFYKDGRFVFNFKVCHCIAQLVDFIFVKLCSCDATTGWPKLSARTAKGKVWNSSVSSKHWFGR